MASPAKQIGLDSPLHLVPRFEPDRAGLDGLNPPVDFGVPGTFGIRVRRAVEAGEEFCDEFGAGCKIQAECIRQHGLGALGLTAILRPRSLIDKRQAEAYGRGIPRS